MSEVFILYMYRMFWALFLGALLAMGFRRSWNAEHGKMTSWMEDREHAVVWLDPIVFPVMIIFFAAINLWVYGSDDGVEYGLCLLIDIFVFVSVYFTGLMFLLPMLRRRYTARTCAVLWLVPVFLFYQPHMLYLMRSEPPLVVLYLPGILLRVLLAVWAAGFLVLFGTKIGSHIWFSRRLRQHSRPILDPELLEIWEKVRRDLDMHIPVDLRYCSLIRTPLTIGMRKKSKVTYLPERAYGAEEAELIFSHELHHVQRRDTHTKCFLEFCKALGWIHPLVWLAARRAQDDLELSCDEIVLERADAVTRRKYAELLLSTAGGWPWIYDLPLGLSPDAAVPHAGDCVRREEKAWGCHAVYSYGLECPWYGKDQCINRQDLVGRADPAFRGQPFRSLSYERRGGDPDQ